jgi:hypothetical protein
MIALLAVSLSILFVNMVPVDTEGLEQRARFTSKSECNQVVKEDQVCVPLTIGETALYVPR